MWRLLVTAERTLSRNARMLSNADHAPWRCACRQRITRQEATPLQGRLGPGKLWYSLHPTTPCGSACIVTLLDHAAVQFFQLLPRGFGLWALWSGLSVDDGSGMA